MSNEVYVSLEFTPNPNTLKYSVNRELISRGAANFVNAADAEQKSPLAARLFAVPGISGVMVGKNFVTVTKTEEGDWDLVHKGCSSTIQSFLEKNEPIFTESYLNAGDVSHKGGQTEVEQKIRDILDRDIRPAVAMDGGDITFEKFEDGVVYLYLQGSCSGCPSSTATLKVGIETRLREAIPEVREVVSV